MTHMSQASGVNRKGNKGDDNFGSKHSKPLTGNMREDIIKPVGIPEKSKPNKMVQGTIPIG